jgi:hypothetical protein
MSEINYNLCIKRAYPGITDADFSLEQDEQGLRLIWLNTTQYGPAPYLQVMELQWLALVKEQAILSIKDLRRQGLDKAALSAGILAIYDANYLASIELLAGRGTTVMKSGITAESFLTGFGSKLNMTATQFANYIIAENQRVGPTAYEVEKRYLALAYGGDAGAGIYPISVMASEEQITAAVEAYKTFCGV